jgi:hypothetical protein
LTDYNSITLALKTENLDDFQKLYAKNKTIQGRKNSALRFLEVSKEKNYLLEAIERNGTGDYDLKDADDVDDYLKVLQSFETRRREHESSKTGMEDLKNFIETATDLLNKTRLADAFFRAEREYWERKNKAGKIQKKRQDDLALGWANNDHHTFRSSRGAFSTLVEILELTGMKPREKFYAGAQAGWGAQIMEDPATNLVAFVDVDLGEDETNIDFAKEGLPERQELGTVGLWVALHGESIMEAGLHHLAASFSFDALRDDLEKLDVVMMKPFSNFAFLKQAFTQGELWKTDEQRTSALKEQHRLTQEQATRFVEVGALGSHLENIQRGSGFKGFNQSSVSAIIKETDPRKLTERYA